MPKIVDLEGERFGRLTVVGRNLTVNTGDSPSSTPRVMWEVLCDCGQTKSVQSAHLRSGVVQSCGCLKREKLVARNTTHGLRGTPEYEVWGQMVQRCTNQSNKRFSSYGGRGIELDPEWLEFENFYRDMGPRPTAKHSIERCDNDLGYSKDNCEWAPLEAQNSNTRRNCRVVLGGVTKTITQWCRDLDLNYRTVKSRLVVYGWEAERAFSTPTSSGFTGTK